MASDALTTIQTLEDVLQKFRDERDWKKFHHPKNLAEAIAIEAAELLELFLWRRPSDIRLSIKDPDFKSALEEELADVLCFSLNLANVAGIDVARAIARKIELNRLKYPVEMAKGKATKYDRLK